MFQKTWLPYVFVGLTRDLDRVSQHTKNVTPRQQRVPRKAKAAKAKAKVKAKPKKKGSQTKRDENGGLLI